MSHRTPNKASDDWSDLNHFRDLLVRLSRLQSASTTGVDSRGREGTPGDSIDGEKRRGIRVMRRKSRAVSRFIDGYGSGLTPAASPNVSYSISIT